MKRPISFGCVFLLSAVLMTAPAAGAELCLSPEGNQTRLSLCGSAPFHATTAHVTDARLVEVPGSSVSVVVWKETPAGDATVPYYAVSLDGQSVNMVEPIFYDLRLRYARFDPALETPAVDAAKGFAYPLIESGPCPCPSTVTCGTPCGCDAGPSCPACAALPGGGFGAQCVKTCIGGLHDGLPCRDNDPVHDHCPGGACGAGSQCDGPPHLGTGCSLDTECAPAKCVGTAYCRDKCARCTP
jgi:hypothetical protein